ncbi:hypothetical protein ACWEKT_40190 [Nocardia takedensis]|uniref:hypothetical protein n=1 Tax=Nocardia takedensis TaxID=259390 RepID=UPI003F772B8B
METEAVKVADIVVGDVIQAPEGYDIWRRVEEIREHVPQTKSDGSGEVLTAHYFVGPYVHPKFDHEPVGSAPGLNHFNFNDDQEVIRVRRS